MKIIAILIILLQLESPPANNRSEINWPVGCWDCRGWGAIRLLEDRYAIDLDPEGHLQNWGVWQWYDQHTVIIMWMESNMLEFIQKDGNKYMRQSLYSFGSGSNLEEVKKIGK